MFMYLSKKLKKKSKGFTLIELIVVIAILAILAVIAIPRLIGFTANAKVSADQASAAIIAKASEMYAASHNLTTDAERATINGAVAAASVIVTDNLVTTDDIKCQKTGEASFTVTNDATEGLYVVTYTTSGTQLYPVP